MMTNQPLSVVVMLAFSCFFFALSPSSRFGKNDIDVHALLMAFNARQLLLHSDC
jgi:hypothetical protein